MKIKTNHDASLEQLADLHRELATAWSALDAAIGLDAVDLRSRSKLEALRCRTLEALGAIGEDIERRVEGAPSPDPMAPSAWSDWLVLQDEPTRAAAVTEPPQDDDDHF